MTHPTVSEAMPVIIDHRLSWLVGAAGVVGAVLVAGAVFLGVVMGLVYEWMLGVCFEIAADLYFGFAPELTRSL
jgi:hypothetical protein